MSAPYLDPAEILATQRVMLAALVTDRAVEFDRDETPYFRRDCEGMKLTQIAALACDLAAALHAEALRRDTRARAERIKLRGRA